MNLVGGALAIAGTALVLAAAIGVVRLPTALTRIHAQSKAATLGVIAILAGAAVATPDRSADGLLVLAIGLQLVTVAASGHMIGRAEARRQARLARAQAGSSGDAAPEGDDRSDR